LDPGLRKVLVSVNSIIEGDHVALFDTAGKSAGTFDMVPPPAKD
jgi:hypothetical protein